MPYIRVKRITLDWVLTLAFRIISHLMTDFLIFSRKRDISGVILSPGDIIGSIIGLYERYKQFSISRLYIEVTVYNIFLCFIFLYMGGTSNS